MEAEPLWGASAFPALSIYLIDNGNAVILTRCHAFSLILLYRITRFCHTWGVNLRMRRSTLMANVGVMPGGWRASFGPLNQPGGLPNRKWPDRFRDSGRSPSRPIRPAINRTEWQGPLAYFQIPVSTPSPCHPTR